MSPRILAALLLVVGCAGDDPAEVPGSPETSVPDTPDAPAAPDVPPEATPTPDTPAPDVDDTPPVDTSGQEQTTRRLSNVELGNTLAALTGVVPAALDLIPPDSLGYTFDRVVAGQSLARAHLDAYFEIATEVAETLLVEQRLDDLSSACPDTIAPPAVEATTAVVSGATLSLGPEWAVTEVTGEPSYSATLYAPDPVASYSHGFEAEGQYTVGLEIVTNQGPIVAVELRVGGELVDVYSDLVDGPHTLESTVDVAQTGPTTIEYTFVTDEKLNLYVEFQRLEITGPADPNPDPAARRVCAEGLLDGFAARAFRRPLITEERARLLALYDGIEAPSAAFVSLFQAILVSPHFLYVVEVGTPADDAPGTFALNAWERAARLSYALCEGPPDDALWADAQADTLTAEALEAHARRLLDEPCGRATVQRFLLHWLWLNRLVGLNKSPDAFVGFDAATLDGLIAETDAQLSTLVWEEEATLAWLFSADVAMVDPRSAWLWDLPVDDLSSVALPETRRGILTSPALMSVTAPFETTNPVERGVFVLDQLLCEPPPLPPSDLDIAPPPPDPTLTTRERWAAHTEVPACAGCHAAIDPIGFAFEGFDGIGRHRTEENGLPVDVSGGVPTLGLLDGSLEGGAAVALALVESDRLAHCASEHWLRFVLGRHTGPMDEAAIEVVAAALGTDAIREALVAAVTTDAFSNRYAPEVSE